MKKRITRVNSLLVDSENGSAVVEIGDTFKTSPISWTIAVQKKFPFFIGDPYDYKDFSLFNQKIPIPSPLYLKQEHVHHHPFIDVQSIHILGTAASSQVNIGSLDFINSESRVKHIRIYY